MKKLTAILLSLTLAFSLAACGSQNDKTDIETSQPTSENTTALESTPEPPTQPSEESSEVPTEEPTTESEAQEGKTLVVFYSATGNTEEVAGFIASATGGDKFADDQLDEVIAKMKAADVIVIGSPLYWHNICGAVRNMLDRFYGPVENGSFSGRTLYFLFQRAAPEKWMLDAGEYTMKRFAALYGMQYGGMATNRNEAIKLAKHSERNGEGDNNVKRKNLMQMICLVMTAALLFSLAACGNSNTQTAGTPSVQQPNSNQDANAETTDNNSTQSDLDTEEPETSQGNNISESDTRILIAYFTVAENSDVDAVASASVVTIDGVAKGRVQAVAEMIQSDTNGDLFSIQTSTEYPGDGEKLIDFAADEQDANARPELTTHIENPDDYDVVFVGYPNWWYDMPMVMYSFFEEYDFSGKTIIPFNVHNGSRFSSTISTIQELEPQAEVITDGFTVSERNVADAAKDVADWLDNLEY